MTKCHSALDIKFVSPNADRVFQHGQRGEVTEQPVTLDESSAIIDVAAKAGIRGGPHEILGSDHSPFARSRDATIIGP
jgi:hypothetical protein